ncbi:MAG TPA: hypothetical protein P5204_09015 [Kiritimatiellia bacterium]|mgnify:CR=1 FL=1|nr:hypothetical protein [Kiritimatiellia bacterium]
MTLDPKTEPHEPADPPNGAKVGGGWFPVARADQRKILAMPSPHRHSALIVWIELIQYANYRRSTRFPLAQLTIQDRTKLGRRTVGYCISALQKIKLLSCTSPRGKDGKHQSSKFVLKPSASPFGGSPCADNAHGSPCALKCSTQMRTLKDTRESPTDSLSRVKKKNGSQKRAASGHSSGGGGTAAAGPAPALTKTPERAASFIPPEGLRR